MSTERIQSQLKFTPTELRPALEYIDAYWKRLERYTPHDDGTLIGLPEPYYIPSARNETGFAYEEMYYWDSYFIAMGLVGTDREDRIRGLTDNLLTLMRRFQVIPNSGRFYMTGRSQPPFLTSLIREVYALEGDKRWLEEAMSTAKNEYRTVWMGTMQPNWRQVFHGLSRFYDINVLDDLAEAESGWDMTTRFERQALSYIPIDLNALLYKYETDFAETAEILGYNDEAFEWKKRSMARAATINRYLWDQQKRCYFDYNFMTSRRSPVYSLAAFYPLWAGLASEVQAEDVMTHLGKFEFEGGLATSAEKPHITYEIPTQWAYPNGWAPLQYVATEGMKRYGYRHDAERVARKWIRLNLDQFEARGEFLEKYNVVHPDRDPIEGVYPSQSGFGWTNAVFSYFCREYLSEDELPVIESSAKTKSTLQLLVAQPRQTLRRVSTKIDRELDRIKRGIGG